MRFHKKKVWRWFGATCATLVVTASVVSTVTGTAREPQVFRRPLRLLTDEYHHYPRPADYSQGFSLIYRHIDTVDRMHHMVVHVKIGFEIFYLEKMIHNPCILLIPHS